MTNKRIRIFITMAMGYAVVFATGLSAADPAPATTATTKLADTKAPSAVATSGAPVRAAAPVSWDDIKNFPFESRTEFAIGLRQLTDRLEVQIGELTANREHMRNDSHDWDFAMIEMTLARSDLKSLTIEATNATAGTWDEHKAKVAKIWLGSQKAYQSAQRIVRS